MMFITLSVHGNKMDTYNPELEIFKSVFRDRNNVLLCGAGGTGKSYLLNKIAHEAATKGMKVFCTATTGVASLNLTNGKTFHSYAGIGTAWQVKERLYRKVCSEQYAVKRIRTTDILIVDEISMFGSNLLTKVDYVIRKIKKCESKPFGGIQVVFGGDFMQLPPVKDEWIFGCKIWGEFNLVPFTLKKGWRYDDPEYFDMMMRIREGTFTHTDITIMRDRVQKYDKLEKEIAINRAAKRIDTIMPTILYSRKKDAIWHNNEEMKELLTVPKDYYSNDDFTPYNKKAKYDHYVDLLNEIIPKKITLKVGAQVMLKINLDTQNGLVNGSRGVVLDMSEDIVTVKFMPRKHSKKERILRITKHLWELENDDAYARRSQFPLILAWALTIHKCQGSTLDYAVCDLGPSVFATGQAYVALSRVRRIEGLYVIEFVPYSIKIDHNALKYCHRIEKEEQKRYRPPTKLIFEDP